LIILASLKNAFDSSDLLSQAPDFIEFLVHDLTDRKSQSKWKTFCIDGIVSNLFQHNSYKSDKKLLLTLIFDQMKKTANFSVKQFF
jgi:hypothetical protein